MISASDWLCGGPLHQLPVRSQSPIGSSAFTLHSGGWPACNGKPKDRVFYDNDNGSGFLFSVRCFFQSPNRSVWWCHRFRSVEEKKTTQERRERIGCWCIQWDVLGSVCGSCALYVLAKRSVWWLTLLTYCHESISSFRKNARDSVIAIIAWNRPGPGWSPVWLY